MKQFIRIIYVLLARPYIALTSFLIANLLPTRFNNYLKKLMLISRGAKIGRHFVCYHGVWIDNPRQIRIGDDVDLSKDVTITTGGNVTIGDRVLIGYGSKILSTNHIIPENHLQSIRYSGHEKKEVNIGHDVWICANCIILPGVTLGKGSVIAAGAVVTKNVEEYMIVGGIPAEIIRSRK